MRHLALVLPFILLSACASTSVAPTAAPTAAPSAAAVASEPQPAGKPPPGQPSATAAGDIPPGYRLVERKGVRLLCSREMETGSRFKRETCMTEAEYAELQARGQDVWQGVRNNVTTCGGTGTGACRGSGQ